MDFCEWGMYSGLKQCNEAGTHAIGGWTVSRAEKLILGTSFKSWPLCELHFLTIIKISRRTTMR